MGALTGDLKTKLSKLRANNADNKVQKANMNAVGALNTATAAAKLASENELKRAQAGFDSKIVQLTGVITAHAATAEREMARLTGVVHNEAKAAAADRQLIKDQTKAMEADLNKALNRAISIGEAKAKAVEQRIAEHLKNTKRFLQVELNESVERAA